MTLNEQQAAAVAALRGPVLISAGAGSGKTRTLAERFARSLKQDDAEAWQAAEVDEVLTITFTEKAAGELAERIRATLRGAGRAEEARAVDGAWISTIHGFCSRVLRRYALEAKLDPAFGLADTVETGRIEEQAFERAAAEVLATADGADLFGSFEFDAVFKATSRITRELRTRGLPASALESVPVGSARDLHEHALALFFGAGKRITACADSKPTTAKLIKVCETAAATLAGIEADRMPEVELARETWKALVAWKPPGPNAAIADVRADLVAGHARLRGEAAACGAEPYVRAVKRLVTDYMGHCESIKQERGLLDFDDLQLKTLELLKESPEIREECRGMFRMAMVDEFQDTDELQAALVAAVAGEDLCTVGDEHQAIYGFRGADVDVYRAHNDRLRDGDAREFSLMRNYRSHDAVLAFVNKVFGSDAVFGSSLKPLEHGRVEPDRPVVPAGVPRVEVVMVHRSGSAEVAPRRIEARAIAERFADLRDQHGVDEGDMVVLLRAYTHAETYAEALRERGFEVAIVGGSRFLDLPEVAVARFLVRAIANPRDEIALNAVLSSDLGRLSDDALWLLSHERGEDGSPRRLWDALQFASSELDGRDAGRARAIRDALEAARRRIGQEPLANTILRIVEECGLDLLLLTRGSEGRQAYANVLKLGRLANEYEAGGGAGPAGFVRYLDAKERYGDHTPPATLGDDKTPAVRIMSVHASKGLEFPVVAVASLGASARGDAHIVRVRVTLGGQGVTYSVRLPFSAAGGANHPPAFAELDERAKSAELEESKRVFYVACTRAQEMLLLAGAANVEKDPEKESECPLTWVRRACPGLPAEAGGEAIHVAVGGVPVRAQVLAVPEDALEPEEVEEPGITWMPAEPEIPPELETRGEDLMNTGAPDRLSYSDLALYDGCGFRFWAQRVLRVGRLDPTGPGDPRRFGSAVHAALQLAVDGTEPSDARMASLARTFELHDEHSAEMRAVVTAFLRSATSQRLRAMPLVKREWAFGVRLRGATGHVDLVGAIDAYGREGGSALVVDYKTGVSGEPVELRERYALQAECYALSVLHEGCEDVTVVFTRPQVLDATGAPQEVVYQFTRADMAGIEETLLAAHARMTAGEYEALGSWSDQLCPECPIAQGVCDVPRPPLRSASAG